MFKSSNYNPDILSCLANLSSDEVFTPPKLVNQMLDLLPGDIWANKNVRFLDPVCKTGVFLREIAKRLDQGLEKAIPNRQERMNHIFQNQLFGIAITELTALLSRRSVYCTKTANGKYSVCNTFDDPQGNIRFKRVEHKWSNGRCVFCRASQREYDRGVTLETHAYQLIHTKKPQEIFNMKFDVIVGNPPYQLSDGGGTGTSAVALYNLFVTQSKKLRPRYLAMIIPSRWFAGGKGLNDFRDSMLHDHHITHLVDYPIAADVFPGVRIIGGVCYFLWERDNDGQCKITTIMNDSEDTMTRDLDEFDTFVRFNQAIPIIHKVRAKTKEYMSERVSKRKPFGLTSDIQPTGKGTVDLYALKNVGKFEKTHIPDGKKLISVWKVLISKAYGEGGESREYPRMILGKPIIAPPPSACTETYLIVDKCNNKKEAIHLAAYVRTRFFRFLVGLAKNTQNISRNVFVFVPVQNLSQAWTDEKLYKKYGLTNDEIAFIESMTRPMEASDE